MNLSPDWVPILTDARYTAVHWSIVGDPCASDRTILLWAAKNEYIVFTHDLDFGAILANTQAKTPSVLQIRSQNILPDTSANLVLNALQQFVQELETGALITIDPNRTRVRILPIR